MDETLLELQKQAEEGAIDAQIRLGCRLMMSESDDRDMMAAASWFEKAALRDSALGYYNLALCHYYAVGKFSDDRAFIRCLQNAADLGYDEAAFQLGWCALKGDVVPQDTPKALSWFKRASKSNHPLALYHLNRLYSEGVELSPDDSVTLFNEMRIDYPEIATDDNNITLIFKDHVTTDWQIRDLMNCDQALHWWYAQSINGNLRAQQAMAVALSFYFFNYGRGIDSYGRSLHYDEAIRAQKRATSFGLERIEMQCMLCWALGISYAEGHGTPLNREEARYWFGKAASLGDPDAQKELLNF